MSGYRVQERRAAVPTLIGADATHAWCSVWTPEFDWVGFDPTNDRIPSGRHVTLAWGRDYGDVSPVKGVILDGAEHAMRVGVDVAPL